MDPSGLSALAWVFRGAGAYFTWKSYNDLGQESQKYCTDTNQTAADYWKKRHENMNDFLPFYQDKVKDIWQNQFGNTGRGIGGVPPKK